MNDRDWLTYSLEPCLATVVGALYHRGVVGQRAADLAADALSFAHAQALRRTQPFESREHCRNWLVRVAVNNAVQTLRTEARHLQVQKKVHADGQARGASTTPRPSPLQPFLDDMKDALDRLPEEDRRLIERRFLDGVTLEQLAEEFGLGITAVWRRSERILRRVRQLLEERDAVPHGWESAPDTGS